MKFVLPRFADMLPRGLATLLPVAALLLASVAQPELARGQEGTAPRDGAIVRAIEIKYAGAVTVSRERILSNMRTSIGQPFSQAGLEEDIRNVYQTGDVTNVRIFGEPMAGGVRVIVIVQSRDVIKEIVLEGVTHFKKKKVLGAITAKSGNALNEEALETSRQKIIELYQGKGYNNIEVQYRVSRDEAAGNAVVYFAVNEGGKAELVRIVFEGNVHIKARAIRKVMKNTKSKTIFSFITKDGRLDQTKLREDLEDVRELFQNKGYIDMEVTQTKIDTDSRGRTTLYIYIKEGNQYRISKLSIKGNKALTEANLRTFLKMKENSLYTPKGLKADVKVFTDFYGSRGYVDVQVKTEAVPGGPGLVDLTYTVDEGIVSYVERINIEGNSITKDKVIRRELALSPGDIYSVPYADASKKRLENLNYFSKVEISPADTLVPGRKDMNVVVEEKRTGELSFGAGFSSVDHLVGQVTLTQGNFDILNFPAFTGGGQKFRLSLTYGQTRKDAVLSITEPYFLDTRFSVTGELFYHNTNYTTDPYTQQNLGGAIGFRRPIFRYLSVRGEYRLENIKISNATDIIYQSSVGTRIRSAVAGGLVYDSRDSVFLTRRGTKVDLGGFVAGGPLGGDTNIYGWNLEASHYISLPYDMILLFNGQMATVSRLYGTEIYNTLATGTNRIVPIEDRLFLGGPNNLRGYDYRYVGPKDNLNNAVGGRSLGRVTTELTFPIIERVRGAVFYDGGVNHIKSYSFGFQNYASDYGVGLRLDLPIGPIRLDYAFPIEINHQNLNFPGSHTAQPMSKSGRFSFNVGYQF
jgi:outer membrane protein insertion porin family